MGFIDLVSVFALEGVSIDGVDIEMISFQFVVFLIVVDFIGNHFLGVETSLIDRVFGKLRFDNFELADMPTTGAFVTEATIVVMMEIDLIQFCGCFGEGIIFAQTVLVIVLEGMRSAGIVEGATHYLCALA